MSHDIKIFCSLSSLQQHEICVSFKLMYEARGTRDLIIIIKSIMRVVLLQSVYVGARSHIYIPALNYITPGKCCVLINAEGGGGQGAAVGDEGSSCLIPDNCCYIQMALILEQLASRNKYLSQTCYCYFYFRYYFWSKYYNYENYLSILFLLISIFLLQYY